MRLFRNKKGSELTEKIMVTAFSVAAAAACIIWMVGIINISKAVDINGGGAGGGAGALTVGAERKKVVHAMSSDQEWNLYQAIQADVNANGGDSSDAVERMKANFCHSGAGYVPEMFADSKDEIFFGDATFSTLPSNDAIASAAGGTVVTYKGAGYADVYAAELYGAPTSSALIFVLCALNENNITPACKTASEVCDINTPSPCSEQFFKDYIFGGATAMCPLSGSGNLYLQFNSPGLVPSATSDATTQNQAVGFGEAGLAYAVYEVDGVESVFFLNQDDGNLYEMNTFTSAGSAVIGSIQPASSPYFSTSLLNID